jgi:hypothetical protein
MSLVPSFAELERHLQRDWRLRWDEGQGLAITLLEVAEGAAMNARYHCYNAVFAQPAGVQLPQHGYRLCSPEGAEWHVMLTPIGPDEDGDRHLLQAIFHVKRDGTVATQL